MKGFTDSDGKFRPITTTKGSRKKLHKTREASGMKMSTGIRMSRVKLKVGDRVRIDDTGEIGVVHKIPSDTRFVEVKFKDKNNLLFGRVDVTKIRKSSSRKKREKNIVGNFSKNTDFTVEFVQTSDGDYRMIVAKNLINDNPILLDNGSVGWDFNIVLPEFVRSKAERILRKNGSNRFTFEDAHKIIQDKDFVEGIQGFGFFVEYLTPLKSGSGFSKKKVSNSFRTPEEAIAFGKTKQNGNNIVNILDGRSVIGIDKIGSINLSGEYSGGV